MKAFTLALCLVFLSVLGADASWKRIDQVWSRILEHNDGTRTESKQDINTKSLEERTFKGQVLVKRRLFQLDDLGNPKAGLIFDGKKNLVARIQYYYDEYDELKEERLYNRKGKVIRRLVYGLDKTGLKSKPVAFTYDPNAAPGSQPTRSTEDFDPIMPLGVKTGAGSGIPGGRRITTNNRPGLTDAPAPRKGTATTTAPPKEKKKGFFSRIFGGKK